MTQKIKQPKHMMKPHFQEKNKDLSHEGYSQETKIS